MTKYFLVKVDLPDWAGPESLEAVREEIEQHAGASVAFYTRATHVTVKCAPIEPSGVHAGVYCLPVGPVEPFR